MKRIRLIHAGSGASGISRTVKARAAQLNAVGYRVDHEPLDPAALRRMRQAPPDVFVIDLDHVSSQGRDFAMWVRGVKLLRGVPILFAGGEKEKTARVKRQLPDAAYTFWRGVRSALRKEIEAPPTHPVNPGSPMAGYSGTPLPKKLGINEGTTVGLIGAPVGFSGTLGPLPRGAVLKHHPGKACDLVIWFTRSVADLDRILKVSALARSGLWIARPKRASGVTTDITQNHVRRAGLAFELVDYKIAAIDATWSGLKFSHRKR